jgi:hypothetical protein
MRTLTIHEKRTVRIAGIGIAIYLALFGGFRVWAFLQKKRSDYKQLVQDAQSLKQKLQPYEDKVLVIKKLMEAFHMDPAKLSRATLVADTSAAIQRAATGGGVQLGPIRETAARPAAKELAAMQIEALGPVPALMTFLHRIDSLGYPLIIDSVQIGSDPTKPGMVKLTMTLVILDFQQWKTEGPRHA